MVLTHPLATKDLAEQSYRSYPAISQSELRAFHLAPTPHHYYMTYLHVQKPARSSSQAMGLGTLLHARNEFGGSFTEKYIQLPKGLRAGTKAHKEFSAANLGKTLVKASDWEASERMHEAILSHPTASLLLSDGYAEISCFAEYKGHAIKGRFDYHNEKLQAIIDIKTARSGDPFSFYGFSKACREARYDWQAAFYLYLASLCLPEGKDYAFFFVSVENSYPYAVAVHTLTPDDLKTATTEVLACLDRYIEHKSTNYWPAYGNSIHTIQMRSA